MLYKLICKQKFTLIKSVTFIFVVKDFVQTEVFYSSCENRGRLTNRFAVFEKVQNPNVDGCY